MSQSTVSACQFTLADEQKIRRNVPDLSRTSYLPDTELAEAITRTASRQTYLTIRYLADRPLVDDAYRAYAYFRWLDDVLDEELADKTERLAFLARQQEIIACSYQGEWPGRLCAEERLVADLIASDPCRESGLGLYIHQMMAVMAFDAERKGRLISQAELDSYTRALATAVTEALHFFIGHDEASPSAEYRYLAVNGAHITHMLRDVVEDTAAGYYNIAQEFLVANGIGPADIAHDAYRTWAKNQVELARKCFAGGRVALAQVTNLRCRMAGYAYIARFEVVLDIIEREEYRLRAAYPERKGKRAALKMALATVSQTIGSLLPGRRQTVNHLMQTLE